MWVFKNIKINKHTNTVKTGYIKQYSGVEAKTTGPGLQISARLDGFLVMWPWTKHFPFC